MASYFGPLGQVVERGAPDLANCVKALASKTFDVEDPELRESGITAVYDRHSYDAEKRQALESVASGLQGILRPQAAGRPLIRRAVPTG